MKKILNNLSTQLLILGAILLLSIALPARAQVPDPESPSKKETDKKDRGLDLEMFAETRIEYTDNVFRLTDYQISWMETNDSEDIESGRFKDMDSTSDFIIGPSIGIKFGSESPLGGELELTSWIRYNYHTKNDKSGFPEGRIRLENSIGEKGALTLEGNLLFDYFKKNYISGVNDTNSNGNIPREERIYSAAIYDEYEAIAVYEHRVLKEKDKRLSRLDIEPFMGYRYRVHNSTFSNRDLDIFSCGLGMDMEFISKIDLEIIYQYERVVSPNDEELFLFDETLSGVDVNKDGEIRSNAPIVSNIDRSSKRHTIKINPSIKLTKEASLYLEYRRRISTYTSDNQLDIEHYNVEAVRQKFNLGFEYDFSKAWTGELEYGRTDDHDEEDGDYLQNNFQIKIEYNFL